MASVAAMDDAVEHAGGVARRLACERGVAFEDERACTALGERTRERAACESRADDDDVGAAVGGGRARSHARRSPAQRWARREARREAGARDVALAAAAGRALDRESGGREAVTHRARRAPGRDRRIGGSEPRHRLEQRARPTSPDCARERSRRGRTRRPRRRAAAARHRRRRTRAAARPRPSSNAIRCRLQVSAGQRHASSAASGARRVVAREAREARLRRRRLLDRDEVELAAALRIGAPCRPRREEVVADAEAGLEDDEAIAAAPAPGERVRRRGTRGAPARAHPTRGW